MLFNKTKINNLSKSVLALLAIGLFAIFMSVYLLVQTSEGVLEGENFAVDQIITQFIAPFNTTIIYNIMGYITHTGSVLWLFLGTAILSVYLFLDSNKSNWFINFLLINMFGISALTKGLKLLFERERPEMLAQYDGTGFSFPSGHTTGAVAFYGFIIYLVSRSQLNKKLKWIVIILLAIWILAVAMSRVFINVHYFTDIIAGLAIGFLWILICIGGLELLLNKKGRRITSKKLINNKTRSI